VPPADEGQSEEADAAQRGDGNAQTTPITTIRQLRDDRLSCSASIQPCGSTRWCRFAAPAPWMVSSQDANRQWIYAQAADGRLSAEGFAGTSFSPLFPAHGPLARETKQCSDCHLSDRQDNNAIMAQTLAAGKPTAVNFIGRFAWVAEGDGGAGSGGGEPSATSQQAGDRLQAAQPWRFPDWFKGAQKNAGGRPGRGRKTSTMARSMTCRLRGE